MKLQTLVVCYSTFAAIAIVANLGTQRAILQFGDTGAHFVAAVLAGTIVGLFIKYLLDKRYIFQDVESSLKEHSRKFSLYTAMGIVTTAIFWGMETAFWLIWETSAMRELGAVIGLTLGYIVKYRLDRRFVFTDRRLEAAT